MRKIIALLLTAVLLLGLVGCVQTADTAAFYYTRYEDSYLYGQENAVIAAEGLGLSSVYLGDIMEHYEDRAEALGCPAGVVPCLTLCIGYATEGQLERAPIRRYQQKYLIHDGQYQDFERDELLEMLRDRGQYETMEDMAPWLERFSKRSVEGKGALERTRSIREAVRKMQEI